MCGLTTPEVARAFLVSEPTMAARITRAKKKIAAARIPYMVPAVDELPERLQAVLDVVHLVFTTGYTAPVGDELVRVDLVERAADLAHMLVELLAEEADAAGLLALILLTDARRSARVDPEGHLHLLADQVCRNTLSVSSNAAAPASVGVTLWRLSCADRVGDRA